MALGGALPSLLLYGLALADCCENGGMIATPPPLLDAFADCLQAGEPLDGALTKVALAGLTGSRWAQHVRRFARRDTTIAATLRAAGVLDDHEQALVSAPGADEVLPDLLRAIATRRRRRATRASAVLRALVGPFFFAALTVVLDPLANLVTGGDFLWPATRGLVLLVVATLAAIAGTRAALRGAKSGPAFIGLVSRLPVARILGQSYLEEELTTFVAPFAAGGTISPAGLRAVFSVLEWARLPPELGPIAEHAAPGMSGLEAVAKRLSLETNLAIIGGVASGRIAARLRERGDAIATVLTARLRVLVRAASYALVVVLSIGSLANMVARGLPGVPHLPGGHDLGEASEEKQLEELMKELQRQQ